MSHRIETPRRRAGCATVRLKGGLRPRVLLHGTVKAKDVAAAVRRIIKQAGFFE